MCINTIYPQRFNTIVFSENKKGVIAHRPMDSRFCKPIQVRQKRANSLSISPLIIQKSMAIEAFPLNEPSAAPRQAEKYRFSRVLQEAP